MENVPQYLRKRQQFVVWLTLDGEMESDSEDIIWSMGIENEIYWDLRAYDFLKHLIFLNDAQQHAEVAVDW